MIVTAASTAISTFRSNQELIETHKSSLFGYFGLEEESATSSTDVSASSITTNTDETTTITSGGATAVMTSLYCLVMLSGFIVRDTM